MTSKFRPLIYVLAFMPLYSFGKQMAAEPREICHRARRSRSTSLSQFVCVEILALIVPFFQTLTSCFLCTLLFTLLVCL